MIISLIICWLWFTLWTILSMARQTTASIWYRWRYDPYSSLLSFCSIYCICCFTHYELVSVFGEFSLRLREWAGLCCIISLSWVSRCRFPTYLSLTLDMQYTSFTTPLFRDGSISCQQVFFSTFA